VAAIREAKVEMILNGAKDAFSKLGFHKTRLEDIAGAAGFSKTALYYYYESKEEIFLDLMIREGNRMLEKINSGIADAENLLDAIRRYARALLEGIGEHFTLISSMMDIEAEVIPDSKLFHKHHDKLKLMHEYAAAHERLMGSLIEKGRRNGEIAISLDDALLSDYINSLLQGIMQRWCRDKRMGDINAEIDNLLAFLKPVLAGKAAVAMARD
jgi:AcrR family transcriptional regulator